MTQNSESFEAFTAAAEDGQEWEIDYEDGPTRTTSLSWIAYRAKQDPEADVREV